MADVDKTDPDLKYLVVDRHAFNDPTTQVSRQFSLEAGSRLYSFTPIFLGFWPLRS